jgi:hypothetical protein
MKRIYYIYFLASLLFSCEQPISEFQSQNFIKYFGSGYDSDGNDVIELSDGSYVFVGYDEVNEINGLDVQIFVAKVDKNGNLIWSNTYGIFGNTEEAKIVKEVSDGFLIAGTSLERDTIHSFIMKTNAYGDSLWYKEFGNPSFNIIVNDFIVNSTNIFVAGQSTSKDVTKTDYYTAKLSLTGEVEWNKINYPESNSAFKRVFLEGDSILLVGLDGNEKKISIVTLLQSNGNTKNYENAETVYESVADALLVGDQLYILANTQSGTQLSKLNSSHILEWQTELISSITGKTIAYNEDGTLMICGESIVDGNSIINCIKVDANGSAEYGSQSFRTFQGTISRIIQTKDKGLILVGTTNPTFGANVQLIKTDMDLFLLKP